MLLAYAKFELLWKGIFQKIPMTVLLLALVESIYIYLIVFAYIAIYGIVSEQSTRIRSLQADFEKTLNEKNQVFF